MSKERRRYFRTDDIVSLHTRTISKDELTDRLEEFFSNQHAFSIRNEYNHQLEEHLADFRLIENRMPELARYLAVLQNQIALLTEKLLPEDEAYLGEEQGVSLSAQGIAFYSDQPVDEGEVVELNLKLLPEGQKIVSFARVVKVQTETGKNQGRYKISLDFEHIHETDREILIKHVHGKQMRALGDARFEATQSD